MNRLAPLLVLVLLPTALPGREEASGPAVPLVGRPADFSGASGRFRVTMDIDDDRVALEEPFLLIATVVAEGPYLAPPERLPLSEALLADFHVEGMKDGKIDDRLGLGLWPWLFVPREPREPLPIADHEAARAATLFGLGAAAPSPLSTLAGLAPTQVWEFRYRLRPKHRDIREVPGVGFCFHDPFLHTASRPFMTDYAEPIPFEVLPPTTFPPSPLRGPDWLFAWTSPSLATQSPPGLPGPLVILALLAVPVLGCLVWYAVWQRLYPDALRQASLRRSRAARKALADLGRLRGRLDATGAAKAAGILARYLRERFDQPQTEPTPREAAEHFDRLGLAAFVEPIRRLLEQLDARRFGAPDAGEADLVAEIRTLVLALEEATCPPSA